MVLERKTNSIKFEMSLARGHKYKAMKKLDLRNLKILIRRYR